MIVLLIYHGRLADRRELDERSFAAAASLATGVFFAHRQWRENGYTEGDVVSNLEGFRRGDFDMTFSGWPRGTSDDGHHTNMSQTSCEEIWSGMVEDHLQSAFTASAEAGSLGVCRYFGMKSASVVEYDVKRGRVILTMG